ncbi:MAG TPA: flap structure-specific endonuclease, partial [Acidilobales archaeon]|nr:flap structure-specific endonuclease [Acidilobales archaeon]
VKAEFPVDPLEIKKYFLNPPKTETYSIEWKEPDEKAIIEILVYEHDFSETRVKNALQRLKKAYREHIKTKQLGLDIWFR